MVKAIFFDVGETLVDETRWWSEHARRIDVSPIVLAATLGVTIERGEDHRAVWGYLGHPVPDLDDEIGYVASDLYPDVRQCLTQLRTAGCFVGVAGNQGANLERDLRSFDLDVDLVTSSVGLGVASRRSSSSSDWSPAPNSLRPCARMSAIASISTSFRRRPLA